ncbi:trace amine-associated receptor 1-like [Mya arenaria]|uniref:trace amine-associated receptor 1-like n=1 Tax=Mya arenaria TaxID=6604 RepID=UPI0022E700C5|nr:trace amine-associated receptor 1-like [Mya arenaria]
MRCTQGYHFLFAMNSRPNSTVSENDTTGFSVTIKDNVHSSLVMIAWFVISSAVLTNLVIVVTFLCKIRARWPPFTWFVFSLSICDFTVGTACVPILMAESFEVFNDYFTCMPFFFVFFLAQLASLYHVMGICFHRSWKIKSVLIQNRNQSKRFPLILSTVSWSLSCVICFIPFYVWRNENKPLKACVVDELFTKEQRALGFLAIFYVIPQLLTDMFYTVAVVRFRSELRRVLPLGPETNTVSVVDPESTTAPSSSVNRQARTQRHVQGTIGLTMLLFNMFTLPIAVVMVVEHSTGNRERNLRYIVSGMFVLNSAVNPFVYAFKIRWLRKSVREVLVECIDVCRLCFTQSSDSGNNSNNGN